MRPYLRPSLALLPLCLVALAGCPNVPQPGAPTAKPDTGPPKPKAAPLPDPAKKLEELLGAVESNLGSADGDQLAQYDKKLYDTARGVNPAHPAVDRATKLRQKIKQLLVPRYMDMAEKSFAEGRYDDAMRQVGYVKDSAPAELLARKKKITKRMPGILEKREACAKKWTLRACKLHEQHPDWPLKICKALFEEMIGLDMTPEQVRISWGEPTRVERHADGKQVELIWYYPKGAFISFGGPNDKDLKVIEVHN